MALFAVGVRDSWVASGPGTWMIGRRRRRLCLASPVSLLSVVRWVRPVHSCPMAALFAVGEHMDPALPTARRRLLVLMAPRESLLGCRTPAPESQRMEAWFAGVHSKVARTTFRQPLCVVSSA